MRTLAAQTAAALQQQGRTSVQLGYDDSLFSEPSFNPAWPAHYLPEHVVSRVTALWVDEGRPSVGSGRVDDPSLYAAQTFAAALAAHGITVVGVPTHGVASGGRELASVQSAPLREIVARVLEVSDNEGAEVLSHQVGKAVTGTRDLRRRGRRGHPDPRRASGSPPTSTSTTAAACPARTGSPRWPWCRCSGWRSTPRTPS